MLSLITLDTFSSYYIDFQNWLDVTRIVVTLASVFVMQSHTSHTDDIEALRDFFAVTTVVLWISMVFFLRATMIDFAVFVYGVIYIGKNKILCFYIYLVLFIIVLFSYSKAKNLLAFLTALMIILFAFSQMLVTSYQNHDVCPEHLSDQRLQALMFDKEVLVDDMFGDRYICDVNRTYDFVAEISGFVNTPAPSTASAAYPSLSPAFVSANQTHYEWDVVSSQVSVVYFI